MADFISIDRVKYYPVKAGGTFGPYTPQGVPSRFRKSGGPFGRGSFRLTWNGGVIRQIVDESMTEAMKNRANKIRTRLRRELHRYPGHKRHQLAPRAFARIEARGVTSVRRALVMGSNASFTVYHELGTSRFIGHPQIRQIADEERLQIGPDIRAELTKRAAAQARAAKRAAK